MQRRPSALVCLSGLGTALIIGSTTIAYASTGVSILLALLLLRGGVLILAPVIDVCFKRRVRWFSWLALSFALAGVLVALVDVNSYQMTLIAAMNIVVYLSGYLLRLPCINRMAKSSDRSVTCRYFVEEQMVAVILLVTIPAVWAAVGTSPIATDLHIGFAGFFSNATTAPGLLVGTLYAVSMSSTLIHPDRRGEHVLHFAESLRQHAVGNRRDFALRVLFAAPSPSILNSPARVHHRRAAAASPLHHLAERRPARIEPAAGARRDSGGRLGEWRSCSSAAATRAARRWPRRSATEIAARLQIRRGGGGRRRHRRSAPASRLERERR